MKWLFARAFGSLLLTSALIGFGSSSSLFGAERLQRWMYYSVNLWVDSNITNLVSVMNRAAAQGYTHILLSDSKFSRLATMDAHYFANINYVKSVANSLGLQIIPAIFPVGYSNDILFNDPNLIEALPVTNTLLVVTNGVARLQPDPPVSFAGSDFSNLALWSWHDPTVISSNGAACVNNPNGQNARIVQTITVRPFRQYHISVHTKTLNFLGTPQVEVLANGLALNYDNLGVQHTEDWTTHHVIFNSQTNTSVSVYLGCWDGTTGTLFWDDAAIEELAFMNLVRRPGAPLSIQIEGGRTLVEGVDFANFKDANMGMLPWPGSYDVYHAPPLLTVSNLADGTRLRATWCHAVTVYDGQAIICPSEPATTNLLYDQAVRMHAAFGAKGYMMSHDEIRVMNWCPACQKRNLDAGPMLADNVRTCIQFLRQINPDGDIYTWSDMFDPNHNAHANYFLVRGNLANSWAGLDSNVIILPWNLSTRTNSLQFFTSRGNRQVIAGYYDDTPSQIATWLNTAQAFSGILGCMYTTWVGNYANLEAFAGVISDFEVHHQWILGARTSGNNLQLEFPTISGHSYSILKSPDCSNWQTVSNYSASTAIGRLSDPRLIPGGYYRTTTAP